MHDSEMARIRCELELELLGVGEEDLPNLPIDELEMMAAAGDIGAIYAMANAAEMDNQILVAERWWEVAARQDDPVAMHNLGILAFEQGDFHGAARWWQAASDRLFRLSTDNLYVIEPLLDNRP